MHLLDQTSRTARFSWHQDTDENTTAMVVRYTMVVLLEAAGSDDPPLAMRVAGAARDCEYKQVGSGYVFESGCFHLTVGEEPGAEEEAAVGEGAGAEEEEAAAAEEAEKEEEEEGGEGRRPKKNLKVGVFFGRHSKCAKPKSV